MFRLCERVDINTCTHFKHIDELTRTDVAGIRISCVSYKILHILNTEIDVLGRAVLEMEWSYGSCSTL